MDFSGGIFKQAIQRQNPSTPKELDVRRKRRRMDSLARSCRWAPPHHSFPPAPPISAAGLFLGRNVPMGCVSCVNCGRVAVFQHFAQYLCRWTCVLRVVADFVPQADASTWFGFAGGFERSMARRLEGSRLYGFVVVVGVQKRRLVAVLLVVELAVIGGIRT